MGKNREYAQLLEQSGYERTAIAFKLYDKIPENVESYGSAQSFHCAVVAEVWEGRKPFYITNRNILCGGALYSGIGHRKIGKEEFDMGMSQVIGINKGYETREAMRRSMQQIAHPFKHHKYQVIGSLEDVEHPDVVMVVADAYRVMRLCKAYTWKTGEMVHGLSGTGWCTNSFPLVLREKTMTFNMGDETSRVLMNLEPGEMYCFIHYEILPIVVENLKNIQTGMAM